MKSITCIVRMPDVKGAIEIDDSKTADQVPTVPKGDKIEFISATVPCIGATVQHAIIVDFDRDCRHQL